MKTFDFVSCPSFVPYLENCGTEQPEQICHCKQDMPQKNVLVSIILQLHPETISMENWKCET